MLDGLREIHDVFLPCHIQLSMSQMHVRHVSPLAARIDDGSSADSYRRLFHHRNPFPYSISVVMDWGRLPVRSILILGLLREKAALSPCRGLGYVVEPVTQA